MTFYICCAISILVGFYLGYTVKRRKLDRLSIGEFINHIAELRDAGDVPENEANIAILAVRAERMKKAKLWRGKR